jgi:hypothetical protein
LLHEHGSNNPNGVTSSGDRYAMHPYFIFKDLVTIFAFLLALSVMVFFYPNVLGQQWPIIIILIVYIINACAICWKDILLIKIYKINIIVVKIYNKTIISFVEMSGLFIIKILSKYIILKINPIIVKYYYKISNQPITKIIIKICIKFYYLICMIYLLLVGISETLRAKPNDIRILCLNIRFIISSTTRSLYIRKKDLVYFLFNESYGKLIKEKENSILKENEGIKNESLQVLMEMESLKVCSLNKLNKLKQILDNHNNEISLEFKQWFAGLTDGDGYIYVNKEGYVGYELTLNSMDEKVLRIIQNKFGGNVHARAGYNAIRYRTQNKNSISKIINCLNGLVINNLRLAQLHRACVALNIPIQNPISPDIHSAYISGLLDSDGYINIYKNFYNETYRYQLTIAISNKSLCNVECLSNIIGGQIYFDKKLNGHYKWVANSKLLHYKLYDYFYKFPPKTVKGHRTFLIKEFHELNEIKAYLETDKLSVRYKIWQDFFCR